MQVELSKMFDVVFYRYKQSFRKMHPEIWKINKKKFWLPHSIDTSLYKDYKLDKEIGILLPGVIGGRYYPLRRKIHGALKDLPFYRRIRRPKETVYKQRKWPIRREYAKLLNKSKIVITDGATVKYAVMKYFEIPACNSMLMAGWFDELNELGFVKNENMVALPKKLNEIEEWMLPEKEEELKAITQAGYRMIRKKHTTNIRAKEFVSNIKEII
jgi:hypothetical protein